MVYSSGKSGKSDNKDSGGVGCGDVYNMNIELVLVLLSNPFLLLVSISVSASGPSSCSTLYCLPTTFKLPTTVLRKNVNDFGLKRLFYSK